MITVIGLGPADAGGLSVAARDALRAATHLLLRTERHPAAQELRTEGIAFESLDSLYETAESFEALYPALARRVLDAARQGDAAYAVPGHPLVGEESVRLLLDQARAEGIPVRIVGSASFIEPALALLGRSLGDGLLLLDALSLIPASLQPDVDLLLYQVYDSASASSAKLALMRRYPDDHTVTVVRAAGAAGQEAKEELPLHRLDRAQVDHLTSVFVPALTAERRKKTFEDLVEVMARLRGEGGCPWDREQDHRTLRRYMIEECYEAVEAIDADDMDALEEELGDVLLQVVFHAQLEAEAGIFDIGDIIDRIVDKLIRRHPHVFGDTAVADSDEVLRNWEKIKKAEKEPGWRESILDGVPSGLPALMRAMEISKRAVKVGFEWERFEDVLAKLDEEVRELKEALSADQSDRIADEIGDLLFTIVNIARWKKLDPEESLRAMLLRFSARFRYIEQAARAQNRSLDQLTLAEMDELWNQAKDMKG